MLCMRRARKKCRTSFKRDHPVYVCDYTVCVTVFSIYLIFFIMFSSKDAINLSVKALMLFNASECHDTYLDLKSVQTHLPQTSWNKQSQQGQQVQPRWMSVITAEILCTSNAHPNTRVTSEMRGLANSANYPSTY